MSPGKTLRDARVLAGLTQAELADQVGTSPQNIGKLERDEIKQPSRELMKRIGQVLDIPFETLMFGGHAPPKLSESAVILARQIEELPPEYKVEVYSILLRAKHESETAAKQKTADELASERKRD
jgi:transcriptional regulator with XRE-family HTH domain